VVALSPHPLRIGWVTSDGTHTVHDVVAKAEEELSATVLVDTNPTESGLSGEA
jgi:hypothetical protein